jgi:hypothetical protein
MFSPLHKGLSCPPFFEEAENANLYSRMTGKGRNIKGWSGVTLLIWPGYSLSMGR